MKKIILFFALIVFTHIASAQYGDKAIKVGSKAPEISCVDYKGNAFTLSEINKGKYVLVDFWASWCVGCRAKSPVLRKMYAQYSQSKFKGIANGFTIVSFSVDKDNDKWLEAIKKDSLTWPYHVCDPKGFKSETCFLYGIIGLPQLYLVDPNGNIAGKYSGVDEAQKDIEKYAE